ncbi:MAG: hypothetical protein AABM30_03310 [Actinomycetota bacterium]
MNALLYRLIASFGICAAAGAIDGILTGFVFGLFRTAMAHHARPADKLLLAALILGGAGWLVVLFVVGVAHRYGIRAIALPALFTSLLTSIATVFIVNAHLQAVGALVGLVVGLLVGSLLCALCERLASRPLVSR